jgi:hypothetical protein
MWENIANIWPAEVALWCNIHLIILRFRARVQPTPLALAGKLCIMEIITPKKG